MKKNVPFLFRFCFCLPGLSVIQYIYTQTLYMLCYLKAVMWKSSCHAYFSAIKNLFNSKGSGSFMNLSSIYLLPFIAKALNLTPRLLRPPHNTSQTKEKLFRCQQLFSKCPTLCFLMGRFQSGRRFLFPFLPFPQHNPDIRIKRLAWCWVGESRSCTDRLKSFYELGGYKIINNS